MYQLFILFCTGRTETLVQQEDVKFLLEELCNYTYKWEDIGLVLGFVDGELKNITHSSPQASTQHFMKEMLVKWAYWPIKDHPCNPTLEDLCDALRSKLVGLGNIADDLYLKKNSLPSQTTN